MPMTMDMRSSDTKGHTKKKASNIKAVVYQREIGNILRNCKAKDIQS